ncbi:hypothetical protein Q8A73_013306 [Channa argus]|nr:hypothetical protein Q8A73_013306 [Channa argus]
MKNLVMTVTVLLCGISWISVSGSETLETVEVQSGEEVTLLCSNISTTPTQTDWFRLAYTTKPRCISSMYKSDNRTTYCWVSRSESHYVEVQSEADVTLLCSNYSSSPSQIIWFKLVNKTQPQCISSMYSSAEPAKFCSGAEKGKFELTSNRIKILFMAHFRSHNDVVFAIV